MSDLRSKKKLATYHALAAAARTLAAERGPDAVTVEEIADAAGVSPRTFFNYFSCKEEAIVGSEPSLIAALVEQVTNRPSDEDPLTVLEAVLTSEESAHLAGWHQRIHVAESGNGSIEPERSERWKQRVEALKAATDSEEVADLADLWRKRMEMARRFPQLLPRHLAGIAQLERELTGVIATRLNVDAASDPYPRLVVVAALATIRSTIGWWLQSDRSTTLGGVIHEGFEMLRSGLGTPPDREGN